MHQVIMEIEKSWHTILLFDKFSYSIYKMAMAIRCEQRFYTWFWFNIKFHPKGEPEAPIRCVAKGSK